MTRGTPHTVSIPQHRTLHIGTLSGIIGQVADYLEIQPDLLAEQLFGKR